MFQSCTIGMRMSISPTMCTAAGTGCKDQWQCVPGLFTATRGVFPSCKLDRSS